MHINRQQLQDDFQEWLDTSEGQELGASGPVVGTIFFFGGIFIGLILSCTIIWTLNGLKCLWWALTLKPFRDENNFDDAQVVIAHGIIMNAKARQSGDNEGPGMVLATFEDESVVTPLELQTLAATIASVYSDGADNEDEQALVPLVEDDTYLGDKATRIPEPWANGRELFTWQCRIDANKAEHHPLGSMLVAFAGHPEKTDYEKVALEQIPWQAVQRCVVFGESEPPPLRPSRSDLTPEKRIAIRKQHRRKGMLKGVLLSAAIILLPLGMWLVINAEARDEAQEVANHPIVVEQLGGIDSASYDFFASSDAGRKTKVYAVSGPKGDGELIVRDPILGAKTVRLRTEHGEWELSD